MSVLRKKMSQEEGIPDIVMERVGLWRSLHLELCDQVSNLSSLAWEPHDIILSRGTQKSLISHLPKSGLVFSFLSADGRFPALAHFENSVAAHVTSKSLGLDVENNISEYEPEKLDLLLFQPIKNGLSGELEKLLGIVTSSRVSMTAVTQGLSIKSLDISREAHAWTEIKFDIQSCPPEDDGSEQKEEFKPSVLTFSLLIPEAVTYKIALAMPTNTDIDDGGEAGPWAEEIYKSLETATVPIRAVIESCEMTVAECTRLEINDVIQLPGISLQAVSLETEMNDKPVKIGSASLGIYKSNRALKLSSDLEKGVFVGAQFVDENAVDVSPN